MVKNKNNKAIWGSRIKRKASTLFQKVGNSLDVDKKLELKNQITDYAKLCGGKNHFLSLIESLRKSHPNPLMSKDASFSYEKGTVKWGKVIFKEKVILLIDIINKSSEDNNLMPNEKIKGYKTIRNLLRTIGPMKFVVSPKNTKDGKGFSKAQLK